MQKNKKRGFTIVELVIVIAVIAILAAVLIPTFSNIIKKANISSDKQLARNMNAALAAADAEGVVVEDISDVLQIVNAAGYILENLNPSTEGYYFVWDEESNQILFIDNGFNVIFNSKEYSEVKSNWWCTVGSVAEIEKISAAGISLYFENDITGDLVLEKVVGFDTGYFTLTGALSISGDDAVTVVLKGNIVGDVTINAPGATIKQYGSINGDVTVTSVASTSFDIFGYISGVLQALEGHINVENSGNVLEIELPNNTTATVTVSGIVDNLNISGTAGTGAKVTVQEGIIQKVTANNDVTFTINNNGFIGEVVEGANLAVIGNTVSDTTTRTYTLKIATRSQLENFRGMVNGGQTFEGITVELTADIDLSGEPWTPIGDNNKHLMLEEQDNTVIADPQPIKIFQGIFDGNGHTITGLTNEGYLPKESTKTINQSHVNGYAYGLFSVVYNATIKNLNMANVNIVVTVSDSACVGSIVGAVRGNFTLENCKASGNVAGVDGVGGLVGYCYIIDPTIEDGADVIIHNCEFKGNVLATLQRVGGIMGTTLLYQTGKKPAYRQEGMTAQCTLEILNCKVEGTVTCDGSFSNESKSGTRVAGLFASSSSGGWLNKETLNNTAAIKVQNCEIKATISGKSRISRFFTSDNKIFGYDNEEIPNNDHITSGNVFTGKIIMNDVEQTVPQDVVQ